MVLDIRCHERIAEEVRSLWRPEDEGGLWALLLDEESNASVMLAIAEGADRFDAQLCRAFARLLRDSGATAVLVVVPRWDGRARASDIVMWNQLRRALSGARPSVTDLLVIGGVKTWSLRRLPSVRQTARSSRPAADR